MEIKIKTNNYLKTIIRTSFVGFIIIIISFIATITNISNELYTLENELSYILGLVFLVIYCYLSWKSAKKINKTTNILKITKDGFYKSFQHNSFIPWEDIVEIQIRYKTENIKGCLPFVCKSFIIKTHSNPQEIHLIYDILIGYYSVTTLFLNDKKYDKINLEKTIRNNFSTQFRDNCIKLCIKTT